MRITISLNDEELLNILRGAEDGLKLRDLNKEQIEKELTKVVGVQISRLAQLIMLGKFASGNSKDRDRRGLR